jgi:hypothetical protein
MTDAAADFLSELLMRVREAEPGIAPERLSAIEHDLRRLYGGTRVYVTKRDTLTRHLIEQAVKRNERPAQIAARFGVGTRTVWRIRRALFGPPARGIVYRLKI